MQVSKFDNIPYLNEDLILHIASFCHHHEVCKFTRISLLWKQVIEENITHFNLLNRADLDPESRLVRLNQSSIKLQKHYLEYLKTNNAYILIFKSLSAHGSASPSIFAPLKNKQSIQDEYITSIANQTEQKKIKLGLDSLRREIGQSLLTYQISKTDYLNCKGIYKLEVINNCFLALFGGPEKINSYLDSLPEYKIDKFSMSSETWNAGDLWDHMHNSAVSYEGRVSLKPPLHPIVKGNNLIGDRFICIKFELNNKPYEKKYQFIYVKSKSFPVFNEIELNTYGDLDRYASIYNRVNTLDAREIIPHKEWTIGILKELIQNRKIKLTHHCQRHAELLRISEKQEI